MGKKIRRRIAINLATLSILGGAVVTPIVVNVANTKNKSVVFDGIRFESLAQRNEFIRNNTQEFNRVVEGKTSYYTYKDGKKVSISDEELSALSSEIMQNISTSYIKTSDNSLANNIDADFGILTPEWYEQTKVTNSNGLRGVFSGDAGKIYTSRDDAIASLMNVGNEVYVFNNIYFKDKNDLKTYLINDYFTDKSNNKSAKGFRIQGPNGELSKEIFFSDDGSWKNEASKYILNNAARLVKIKKADGSSVLIEAKNASDIKKHLTIDDVPYVNVLSNSGKKTWLLGLNANDDYDWSGPTFYYGYDNLNEMAITSNWVESDGIKQSNFNDVKLKKIWLTLDNFLSTKLNIGTIYQYDNRSRDEIDADRITDNMSKKQIAEINNRKQLNTSIKGGDTLLFSEVSTNINQTNPMLIVDETSAQQQKDFLNRTINDHYGPFLKEAPIDINGVPYYLSEYISPIINESVANPIESLSRALRDAYLSENKENIYDGAVELANTYRVSKEFTFLLKIPLLFNYMMDKLISEGASQQLVDLTIAFFKTICSYVENIFYSFLGDSVFQPIPSRKSEGKLNLAKIFGIETNSPKSNVQRATIDFNIQKFYNYFPEVYPALFTSALVSELLFNLDNSGLVPSNNNISSIAKSVVHTLYSDASVSEIDFMVNAAIETSKIDSSKVLSRINNKDYIKRSGNDTASYAIYQTFLNTANNTSIRDQIADAVLNELSELLNANDNWDFVSNDNRFKSLAFYLLKSKSLIVSPNDFINSINLWDPNSFVGMNNAFLQMERELSKSENSDILDELNKHLWTTDASVSTNLLKDAENDVAINVKDRILQFNKNANDNNVSLESNLNLIPFSGIVQTFNEYFAITTMRMLADLSEFGSLFVYDNKNGNWIINPDLASRATDIVIKLKNDSKFKEFKNDMLLLYRGFQSVQERISNDETLMRYRGDGSTKLTISTTEAIIKHTAQYSGVVNKHIDELQSELKNIGVPLKKGKIIAYSGTQPQSSNTTWTSMYDYQSPNANEQDFTSSMVYGKYKAIDISSFVVNDNGLETCVTPNIGFVDGFSPDYSRVDTTPYLIPVNLINNPDFCILNSLEYSFKKYLDVTKLNQLGITPELNAVVGGNYTYFNPTLTYANSAENMYGRIPVKKWGEARVKNISENMENHFVDNTKYSINPNKDFKQIAIEDGKYISGAETRPEPLSVNNSNINTDHEESLEFEIKNPEYKTIKTQYYYYDKTNRQCEEELATSKTTNNDALTNELQKLSIEWNSILDSESFGEEYINFINQKMFEQVYKSTNIERATSNEYLGTILFTESNDPIVLDTRQYINAISKKIKNRLPEEYKDYISKKLHENEKVKPDDKKLSEEQIQTEIFIVEQFAAAHLHNRIGVLLSDFGFKAIDFSSTKELLDGTDIDTMIQVSLDFAPEEFQKAIDEQNIGVSDIDEQKANRIKFLDKLLREHQTQWKINIDNIHLFLTSETATTIIETGKVPEMKNFDEYWKLITKMSYVNGNDEIKTWKNTNMRSLLSLPSKAINQFEKFAEANSNRTFIPLSTREISDVGNVLDPSYGIVEDETILFSKIVLNRNSRGSDDGIIYDDEGANWSPNKIISEWKKYKNNPPILPDTWSDGWLMDEQARLFLEDEFVEQRWALRPGWWKNDKEYVKKYGFDNPELFYPDNFSGTMQLNMRRDDIVIPFKVKKIEKFFDKVKGKEWDKRFWNDYAKHQKTKLDSTYRHDMFVNWAEDMSRGAINSYEANLIEVTNPSQFNYDNFVRNRAALCERRQYLQSLIDNGEENPNYKTHFKRHDLIKFTNDRYAPINRFTSINDQYAVLFNGRQDAFVVFAADEVFADYTAPIFGHITEVAHYNAVALEHGGGLFKGQFAWTEENTPEAQKFFKEFYKVSNDYLEIFYNEMYNEFNSDKSWCSPQAIKERAGYILQFTKEYNRLIKLPPSASNIDRINELKSRISVLSNDQKAALEHIAALTKYEKTLTNYRRQFLDQATSICPEIASDLSTYWSHRTDETKMNTFRNNVENIKKHNTVAEFSPVVDENNNPIPQKLQKIKMVSFDDFELPSTPRGEYIDFTKVPELGEIKHPILSDDKVNSQVKYKRKIKFVREKVRVSYIRKSVRNPNYTIFLYKDPYKKYNNTSYTDKIWAYDLVLKDGKYVHNPNSERGQQIIYEELMREKQAIKDIPDNPYVTNFAKKQFIQKMQETGLTNLQAKRFVKESLANKNLHETASILKKNGISLIDPIAQISYVGGALGGAAQGIHGSILSSKNQTLKSAIKNSYIGSKMLMGLGKLWTSWNNLFGVIGFVFTIKGMIDAFKVHDYHVSYTFKSSDGTEWSWNGGLFKTNAIGTYYEDIRTIANMKLNKPLAINNSYVKDFKYYNGKQYGADENDELLNQYANDLFNGIANDDSVVNDKVELKFTLNNTKQVIESYNPNIEDQKQGIFNSINELNDAVIMDIDKNRENSQYVTSIYTYGDKYGGDWSSLDSSVAISKAANEIANNIRPTYVSMIPNVENGYAYRRKFIMPGNSYDATTGNIVSPAEKGIIDEESMFIINNEANNMIDGNFVQSYSEAIKTAKELNYNKTVDVINKMVVKSKFEYGLDDDLSLTFDEFEKQQQQLGIKTVLTLKIKGYQPIHFVDTPNHSALDNLKIWLQSKLNIQNSYKSNIETYYVYKGKTYNSINDLINQLS